MARHPNRPEPGPRLGLVKAWPGEIGARGGHGATANLDQPSTGRQRNGTGRGEGKAHPSNKGNGMRNEERAM